MSHHHAEKHTNRKALNLAFWLNFIFSIIELIGGALTNSTAIMTDALHDFTDAIAIGMAVWLEKLAGKPATDQFTFGFARFSLLSSLGMSLFLLIGAGFMAFGAVQSLIFPEVVHSSGMLWLAVLGIVVNGLAFLNIKNAQPCSHHNHGHAHNHNQRAIMLHLLEDLLGWVAVLVGAIVIYFTRWYWVDGVLAVLIACYIGYHAYGNLLNTLRILLMATPDSINLPELRQTIINIDSVKSLTSLRVWSLDGVQDMATVNVFANHNRSHYDIQSEIKTILNKAGISEVAVQINKV